MALTVHAQFQTGWATFVTLKNAFDQYLYRSQVEVAREDLLARELLIDLGKVARHPVPNKEWKVVAEVAGAAGENSTSETAAGVVVGGRLALVELPRQDRRLRGNDLGGEFHGSTLAPNCLQLLELSVGRTESSGLFRRCRLSQASCDEEGDEDRLIELESLHHSNVEVAVLQPNPYGTTINMKRPYQLIHFIHRFYSYPSPLPAPKSNPCRAKSALHTRYTI